VIPKKGQISIEYLIVIGFVTISLVTILVVAFYYSSSLQDRIKINQIVNFADEIAKNAEAIYYAGEPSQVTIRPYMPEGVTGVLISNKDIVFNVTTLSGMTQVIPVCRVNVTGNISTSSGLKIIVIKALKDNVLINGLT